VRVWLCGWCEILPPAGSASFDARRRIAFRVRRLDLHKLRNHPGFGARTHGRTISARAPYECDHQATRMYSFSKNRKTVELYPYVRRICDLTTPNMATVFTGRSEDRFNRALPTLLCPWQDKAPVTDQVATCLTSDLADRGVRLLLNQPFRATSVVLGYWIESVEMEEPWYFLGEVRHTQRLGGGFWALGIRLTEFANKRHKTRLAPLNATAAKLLPPSEVSC